MQIKEIMRRDVEVVRPDTPVIEAARRLELLDGGPLPVCEGDRVIGMVVDHDLQARAIAAGHDARTALVRDVMVPDAIYCFEDQDAHDAMRLMKTHKLRGLIVLDRDKKLVGRVTLADLAAEGDDEQMPVEMLTETPAPARPSR